MNQHFEELFWETFLTFVGNFNTMIKFPLVSFSQKHRYLVLLLPAVFLLIGIPLLWAQKTTSQDSLFHYVEQRPEDNKTLYYLEKGNGMTAQQFLDRYGKMLGLGVNDSLHLFSEAPSPVLLPDDYDYSYLYERYYKGVKVESGHIRINMKRGEVAMVASNVRSNLSANTTPTLTNDEALNLAIRHLTDKGFQCEIRYWQKKGRMLIDKNQNLVYVFEITTINPDDRLRVDIDAHTGQIIKIVHVMLNACPPVLPSNANIYASPKCLKACFNGGSTPQTDLLCNSTAVTGTSCTATSSVNVPTMYYGCRTIQVQSCNAGIFRLNNDVGDVSFAPLEVRIAFGENNPNTPDPNNLPKFFFPADNNYVFTDKTLLNAEGKNIDNNQLLSATSAYWAANIAYQFYRSQSINSFNGQNAKIVIGLNSHEGNSPLWETMGPSQNTLLIPHRYTASENPSVGVDVIGHEIGHGVMFNFYGINNIDKAETKTIHEAVGDILGVCTEKYAFDNAFLTTELSNYHTTFDFGEDHKSFPTRYMYCPSSSQISDAGFPQTMTYGSTRWNNSSTSGGITEAYIKGGVITYWFYLLAQSEEATKSGFNEIGNFYEVPSLGFSNTRTLVFRTLKILKDDGYDAPNLFHFKAASMKAAQQLFGECDLVGNVNKVAHAWYAVGMSQTDLNIVEEANCRCSSTGAFPTDPNYISRVKINNLDKTSGENNGYADFTTFGNTVCNILRSNCFNPQLTGNFTPTSFQKAYWTIWIDLDKDGAFDDRERIYSRVFSTAYGYSLSLPIALPSDLPLGTTVMRVAVRKGSPLPVNGCELFDNGEIEDYRVNIAAGGYCGSSNKNELAGADPNAELQVFPNPASQACFLNYIGTPPSHSYLTVDLYQLDGTLADSQQIPLDNYGNVTQSIDLSRLSNGLYMVRVSDGWQNWSQKLQVIQ
ncbi:MAG TPA: GEVED domain-containing protein [Chitinophagales bacterium]|nr:GEVED domain-containing protein [Chitinophagales bacterium]